MVLGHKFEFSVSYDNIYEADGFIQREFKDFKKVVTLVFEVTNDEMLKQFSNSRIDKNKLTIILDNINETYDLIEKIENAGGKLVEVSVTASKESVSKDSMDSFVKSVYKGLEHWNFSRIFEHIEKEKI